MNRSIGNTIYKQLFRLVFALCALSSLAAHGTIISSGFGSVPGAFGTPTFGGSGIPNDTMNWVVLQNAQDQQFILAMSATQRFSSPVVTNDGAGNYSAEPGLSPGSSTASTWNFNFFIATLGPTVTSVMNGLRLYYDVDAGLGTDFGILDFFPLLTVEPVVEGSQNLSFSFLFDGALPFITAPSGSYDPFELGLYNFRLEADYASASLPGAIRTDSVGISVRVSEPGVMLLMLLGLCCVAVSRSRSVLASRLRH